MTLTLWLLIFASVACDVIGHLSLKLGSRQFDLPDEAGPILYMKAVARAPVIWAAFVVFTIEFFVWLAVLSRAPLSIAFPLSSLNYCGVLLVSHFVLKEAIPLRRWAGGALITLGVALIGFGAGL